MKTIFLPLLSLVILLSCGCSTKNLETRKKERYAAFSSLNEETRALVDQGRIKVGMSEDAVYISWGQPDEILQRESESELVISWLYHGVYLDEYRHWRRNTIRHGNKTTHTPYLASDYRPRSYVSAKVDFKAGKVSHWQTLPRPH